MAQAANDDTPGFKWLGVERLLELKTAEWSRGPTTLSATNLAFEWVLRGLRENRWLYRYRGAHGELHENDLQVYWWSRSRLKLVLGNSPAGQTKIFCLELFVWSQDFQSQDEARALGYSSKEGSANSSEPERDTQQKRVQDILKSLDIEKRLTPEMQPALVEKLVLPLYRERWREKKGPGGREYTEPHRRTIKREYLTLYPQK
jgi:hypothetical protein